jgi:YidC/Oxa1 family membrane protein insertase
MWNTLILNPMVNGLLWIYGLIGDFGIAIILFTILIRLLTQPLNAQQMKSMQKMQELQSSKEWLDAQKKYKDDKQKLQMAQAKLLQEKKINPFSSCLPLLIQFPIIIGLYQALIRAMAVTPNQLLDLSKHLYPFISGASLIPIKSHFLWMDLSQPERVFIFGIGIPTLAILVVLTQYLQGKLMTPATSSNPQDQSAQMSKMMNLYMPLFMGYIAYSLSSGLSLYFLATNIISIIQYAAMGKINWRNLLPKKALSVRTK